MKPQFNNGEQIPAHGNEIKNTWLEGKKAEAMSKYPVDNQIITTGDGHEIHYDENEGFRDAYLQGAISANEGEERKFSLKEALGMLMEFAVLYHKSERKDIANDAAEYLTDKFNIDI